MPDCFFAYKKASPCTIIAAGPREITLIKHDNTLFQEGNSRSRKAGRYLIYTVTAAIIGGTIYTPAQNYLRDRAERSATTREQNLTATKPASVAAPSVATQPTKTESKQERKIEKLLTASDSQTTAPIHLAASQEQSTSTVGASDQVQTAPMAAAIEAVNATESDETSPPSTQPSSNEVATIEASKKTTTIVSEPVLTWKELKVKSGDSLSAVFERASIGPNTWIPLSRIKEAKPHWSSLRPGDVFKVAVDEQGNFAKLKYALSVTDTFVIEKDSEGFSTGIATTPVSNKTKTASGTIEDSFYLAALDAKMEDGLIMQLAELFGWDINFALDIRKGDSFAVVYEDQYQNGKRIGRGDILAAEFVNKGKVFRSVRFLDKKGRAHYFTPDGRSMRRAFLQSPVHFSHISSHFNPNRVHPIFKTIRPHRGVDYAARSGTKIKAAGNGYVHFVGRQRGYGKVVILKHAERYSTLYAHMRKFRKGLKKGSKVSQGDVIGYVGQTGAATGPHLHYEFRVAGKHKNPLTVKLPASKPIAKQYADTFASTSAPLLEKLDAVSVHTQFALNSASTTTN